MQESAFMQIRSRGLWVLIAALALANCRSDHKTYETPLDRLRADKTGKTVREELFQERKKERDAMVQTIIDESKEVPITDPLVIGSMRKIPRHAFLSVEYLVEKRAYINRPMSIGYGFQTISQPSVVAAMMQLLAVKPNEKVLEIGTGSGYQASLLAEITPNVFSIEIIKELSTEATDRVHLLGYSSVQTRIGDGYYGWPDAAPFDVIIVTCAAGHIPPPLLSQLAPNGRMVIPVGNPHQVQRLILVTKDANGELKTEDRMPVRFVRMTREIR
jgi:protein-L-isoaspartate(D-aspartate) O-methyltransferase